MYNIRYTLTDDSEMMSYYCTHNSRGDIIGIYNGDGVLRAEYEYDTWGNVISVTDENGNAITSATHVGNLNPFRYRGYYYDTESGFYYLMSRYYDPVTHRFINADGYFQSSGNILDFNMSAYCRNNPIMYVDPTGKHSSSVTCGDPTCTQCRPERRKFINENIDWYNRVTGSNYAGVSYTGEFWSREVYETDKTSTEYKVVHSVAVFFTSFDISADAGLGLEYKNKLGPVSFGASSKAALQINLSGYDDFQIGTYSGNELDVLLWDFQMSSFTPWGSDVNQANVGIDSRISIGTGFYVGAGASVDIGFNYGYFINKINEVWSYNG